MLQYTPLIRSYFYLGYIKVVKFMFKVKPYIQLMRLNRPVGIWLLLWPCLWALGFAMPLEEPVRLDLYVLFFIGAVLMRSAGCVVNDIIDRKLDAKVARTKDRPLANKTLKVSQALSLLVVLLFFAVVIWLMLNPLARLLGLCVIIPVLFYPFAKRITWWPQVVLGFTFNWGVIMAWAAVLGKIEIEAVLLYVAAAFWTIAYDTIYAHQDKVDDVLVGVKSTALRLGMRTSYFLKIFYFIAIGLLWVVGIMLAQGFLYYIAMMVATALVAWLLTSLDINDPENCQHRFHVNHYIGALVFLGVLGGKYVL